MPALGSSICLVTQYIRKLRGRLQPILARASDGLVYVVKFNNNLQEAYLPFNESAGSELFRACGLTVPAWKPLLVSDAFLDENPDCWMETPEGRLRPDAGVRFGSRFLGGHGVRLFEILPETSFKRVNNRKDFWLAWLIDICAGHSDNRRVVFQQDVAGRLNAFFIDHGHMFGDANGEDNVFFRTSRYLDPRIYECVTDQFRLNLRRSAERLDANGLGRRLHALPGEWTEDSALRKFAMCLERLASARFVGNVIDAMADVHHSPIAHEGGDVRYTLDSCAEILRTEIPAAGRSRNAVA